MKTRTWLGLVIPAGLAFGLAMGWLTAGAQKPVEDRVVIYGKTYVMEMTAEAIGPRFKRSEKGWLPSCPSGMDLIRHDPPPDCFWGVAPMSKKPTQGDFECVPVAQASKLPACPKE